MPETFQIAFRRIFKTFIGQFGDDTKCVKKKKKREKPTAVG